MRHRESKSIKGSRYASRQMKHPILIQLSGIVAARLNRLTLITSPIIPLSFYFKTPQSTLSLHKTMHFSSLILLPCAFALPLLSSDSKAVKREEGECSTGTWSCNASTSSFSVCVDGTQKSVGTLTEGISCESIFPSSGSSSSPEKRQDQAQYGQCKHTDLALFSS